MTFVSVVVRSTGKHHSDSNHIRSVERHTHIYQIRFKGFVVHP